METLKEFTSTIQILHKTTYYHFKAINDNKEYKIETNAKQYSNGRIKIETQSTIYFDKKEDMINEYMYQYELNKKNQFTTSIKIIK